MFELYEKVIVDRKENVVGTVIDIDKVKGETIYTVESDTKTEDEYGTLYPLLYCKENELKVFKPSK